MQCAPVKPLHLCVKDSKGVSFPLEVKCDQTTLCGQVFSKVQDVTGIPARFQMLSTGATLLQPLEPLVHYALHNGSHLHLSVKGVGGNGSDCGMFYYSNV